MGSFVGLILAAGLGRRMRSSTPKPLHPVSGTPIIDHILSTLRNAGANRIVTVVGHGGQILAQHLQGKSEIIWQTEQLGTGHAVMQARCAIEGYSGNIVVMPGDTPLFRTETIAQLVSVHEATGAHATMLTMVLEDPQAYGRVVRAQDGSVKAVVEHRDASADILGISEVNTGVFCFNSDSLFDALNDVKNSNVQGEYYLPDVLSIMIGKGKSVHALVLQDKTEGSGVNSRAELAAAERLMRDRKRLQLMDVGVTLISPETTFVDASVQIGPDTTIMPFTVIQGDTTIGSDCVIGPFAQIVDCDIGDGCRISTATMVEARTGNGCVIGPYAYLRPKTALGNNVKVGDFVEVKNAKIGDGSKVPHLSYVGDAVLGQRVNVGAGTITCNFDGIAKHVTTIEDGAFIGANSNLVAPITIGEGAYVGTGSTLTKPVPPGALGIARARQENKEGWVERRKRLAGIQKQQDADSPGREG